MQFQDPVNALTPELRAQLHAIFDRVFSQDAKQREAQGAGYIQALTSKKIIESGFISHIVSTRLLKQVAEDNRMEEIQAWCQEHAVGRWQRLTTDKIFGFEHESDAMLFALTWSFP